MKKQKINSEEVDLSRFHILSYEELLKVNGGSSEDSDDIDDDSDDSDDSGSDSCGGDDSSDDDSDSGSYGGDSYSDDDDDSENGSYGGGSYDDDDDGGATSESGSGGHEVENSNAGVAGAEVGDTITRDDGTEVTLTQWDIDWAQDYCDSHGISYGNSNEPAENSSGGGGTGTGGTGGNPSNENGRGTDPSDYGGGNDSDGGSSGNGNSHGHSGGGSTGGNGSTESNGNAAGSGRTPTENNKNTTTDTSRSANTSHSEKSGHGILESISNFFSGVKDWVNDVFGGGKKSVNEEKSIVEPEKKFETKPEFILNIEPVKDKYGNFLGYGYEAEERRNALEKTPQLNVSLYGSVNVGLLQGNFGGKVSSDYGGQSISSIRGIDTGIYAPGVGLNATVGCSFPKNEGSQSHTMGVNVFGFCGDITFSENGISEFNIGLSSNTGYKGEVDISDFGVGYSLIK